MDSFVDFDRQAYFTVFVIVGLTLFPHNIFASGSAGQTVIAAEAYNFLPDKRPSSLTFSKHTPILPYIPRINFTNQCYWPAMESYKQRLSSMLKQRKTENPMGSDKKSVLRVAFW